MTQDENAVFIAAVRAAGLVEAADRMQAMSNALTWITDRYLDESVDSLSAPDFAIAAAAGLCGAVVNATAFKPHSQVSDHV